MHRGITLGLCLAAGCAVNGVLELRERGMIPPISGGMTSVAQGAEPERDATLEQLCSGKLRLVDLTWPLNARSRVLAGGQLQAV